MKSAFEKLYNNTILHVNQSKVYTKNPNIICCDTNFIQKFFRNEAENTNIMTRALPLHPVLGSQYIAEQLHSL